MTQVWSATQINANLSGGNTVTVVAVGNGNDFPVYGSEGFSTGKYYWETSGTSVAHLNIAQGIGNTSSPITDGTYIGADTSSLGTYPNGDTTSTMSSNGGLAGGLIITIPIDFSSGDRVGHALDLTNNRYWIKNVTTATGWYGFTSAGDPAANTNGADITQGPSTIINHPVVPAINLFTSGDTAVGFFSSSSWVGAAPVGFSPFDSDVVTTILMGQAVF